jgi:hypothetical protein
MAQRTNTFPDTPGQILGLAAEANVGIPGRDTDVCGGFRGPEPFEQIERKSEVERKPGVKLDEDKVQLFKGFRWQFHRGMTAVAEHTVRTVLDPGHIWKGWVAVENGFERYTEALERHLHWEAFYYGLPSQRKEMLAHTVAVAWNAMARLEHLLIDIEDEE